MTIQIKKCFNLQTVAVALGMFIFLLLSQAVTAHAAPHFTPHYQFQTGSSFRYELGKPTTFNGIVQTDVFTANVRRDANVTVVPPRYGVFSGHVQTQPSNHLFPRPQSPHFWNTFPQVDPNIIPRYDTLQMGVNAPPHGNPMNMHNVGQQGVLPSTSIGGSDLVPIGANNATGEHFRQGREWLFQSVSNSSTVTTPAHDGFLPPTSIR